MSAVGFDFGNQSCVVAVARKKGIINVVLNDQSNCETPAIVCFGDEHRFMGTAGAALSMMDPKNTISQIKRLIGRQFSDPELQRDIESLPFSVTEGPDGYPLINVLYLGENRTFTPTQVLGMVLSDLKIIAEKNLNAAVVDCCIGIPVYFTDLQRRAVLDAAKIAGLNPLRLFHETTATALAYGIDKTDLPENEPLNVAFVDVGHGSMQVCIAAFKKGQLKILSHAFDRSLGGRDFDEVLFQHFATKFKDKYKLDVYQNDRACIRLRVACEKLKKVLSANLEAHLNIECLMEEKDVRGFIKREEFEKISIPILKRVRKPLEKALEEAGLTIENIHSVEVVGSGSRVPAVFKILAEFFGKEPRRTMNASKCVAKGCALQCAILSPTFKVREFQVTEKFPLPIALSWKVLASDSQSGAVYDQQSTVVFPKGNSIPSVKALTFYRSDTFTLDVQYADAAELQAPAKISSYTIGPFQSKNSEKVKLKVKARLNLHGIVSVESAMVGSHDKSMSAAPMKKVTKTSVPVSEVVYGGLATADLQKAVEKEFEMALQDRVIEETKDKKNAVEAYVYEMRNKVLLLKHCWFLKDHINEHELNNDRVFLDVRWKRFFGLQDTNISDYLIGYGEDTLIGYRDPLKAAREVKILNDIHRRSPDAISFILQPRSPVCEKTQVLKRDGTEVSIYYFMVDPAVPLGKWLEGRHQEFIRQQGENTDKTKWWKFIELDLKRIFRGVIRGLWILSRMNYNCLGLDLNGIFVCNFVGKIKVFVDDKYFVFPTPMDGNLRDFKGLSRIFHSIIEYPNPPDMNKDLISPCDNLELQSLLDLTLKTELSSFDLYYYFMIIDQPFFWTQNERVEFLFKLRELMGRRMILLGPSLYSSIKFKVEWHIKIDALKSAGGEEAVLYAIYQNRTYKSSFDVVKYCMDVLEQYNKPRYSKLRPKFLMYTEIEGILRRHLPDLYVVLVEAILLNIRVNSPALVDSNLCARALFSGNFSQGCCRDGCSWYRVCDHLLK